MSPTEVIYLAPAADAAHLRDVILINQWVAPNFDPFRWARARPGVRQPIPDSRGATANCTKSPPARELRERAAAFSKMRCKRRAIDYVPDERIHRARAITPVSNAQGVSLGCASATPAIDGLASCGEVDGDVTFDRGFRALPHCPGRDGP